MIDFASFDAGRVALHDTEFELDELVALQRQRALPIAQSKGLELVADACRLRLRTDRFQLGRIIGSLVGNAIQFTGQGRVTLGGGLTESGRVFVRVRDTGRGIKPEDLQGIFAEFAPFDHSLPETGSGWGWGLSVARHLAKLLRGEIEVASEWGKGSAFTVLLPPSVLVEGPESGWKCFLGRSS